LPENRKFRDLAQVAGTGSFDVFLSGRGTATAGRGMTIAPLHGERESRPAASRRRYRRHVATDVYGHRVVRGPAKRQGTGGSTTQTV